MHIIKIKVTRKNILNLSLLDLVCLSHNRLTNSVIQVTLVVFICEMEKRSLYHFKSN